MLNLDDIIPLGTFTIDEVMERLSKPPDVYSKWMKKRKSFINHNGHPVNVHTITNIIFKNKGCDCVRCGAKGKYFLIHKAHNTIQASLIAETPSGKKVLMTKDHTIPKFHNGDNTMKNLKPMCRDCNIEKLNTIEN